MTIRISADHKVSGVYHQWFPASRFGVLSFGSDGLGNHLYLDTPAEIDEIIAELAALRAEMTAPVITDSERTCDQANPASGAWCHLPAPHDDHRDTDGETWTTAAHAAVAR